MTTSFQGRCAAYRTALMTDWFAWLQRMRWCLPVILIAVVFDGFTTVRFMTEYGPALETHLAIRLVSLWFGPFAGPVIGKLCQLAAFAMFSKLWPRCTFPLALLIVVGYTLAGLHNLGM